MSLALEKYNVTQYRGPPCNINPCINGGVCVPRLEDVECKCTKRFYGQRCEKGKPRWLITLFISNPFFWEKTIAGVTVLEISSVLLCDNLFVTVVVWVIYRTWCCRDSKADSVSKVTRSLRAHVWFKCIWLKYVILNSFIEFPGKREATERKESMCVTKYWNTLHFPVIYSSGILGVPKFPQPAHAFALFWITF